MQDTSKDTQGKSEINKAQVWIDNGFSGHLLTLEPGQKRTLTPGWNASTEPDIDLVTGWDSGRNLGLKTGKFPAFDIEDGAHADAIYSILRSFLGNDYPTRSRPGSASRAMIVRLADGETWASHSVRTAAGELVLEVSGANRQLHVEGFRADKGVTLKWNYQPVANKLVELTAAGLSNIIASVRAYLDRQGVGSNVNAGAAPRLSGADKDITAGVDEVEWIMRHVPNDERFDDRETWIRMAHALKGAVGEEGLGAWLAWCGQREQQEDCGRVWEGVHKPDTIGRGQLWKWALEKFPRCELEWDFRNSVVDEEAKAPVNTLTGKDRWLAKEVMRAAVAEDKSLAAARTTLGTWASFEARGAGLSKPKALVPGFAWPGVVHGVIAAPGVGKSLWALHCLTAAAYGITPRDKGVSLPEHPHIIGLFGEDSAAVLWERAAAVRDHFLGLAGGVTAGRTFELVQNKPLELVELDEKTRKIARKITSGLHWLCDTLERVSEGEDKAPVVLVFDMMRHTFFGTENERWQIDALFRVWKAIMSVYEDRTGRQVGIVFTHHMTKTASRAGGSDGFASAGSIGIEGNARVITQMRPVGAGGECIELKLAKTNYGVTGAREFYRKDSVASVYAGETTVVLVPVSEQDALYGDSAVRDFQVEQAVAALHKWMTGAGAGQVVSHGKRAGKGTIDIETALSAAGVQGWDERQNEILIQIGERLNAFRTGVRVQRDGLNCRTALEPVSGWAAPVSALSEGVSALSEGVSAFSAFNQAEGE